MDEDTEAKRPQSSDPRAQTPERTAPPTSLLLSEWPGPGSGEMTAPAEDNRLKAPYWVFGRGGGEEAEQ